MPTGRCGECGTPAGASQTSPVGTATSRVSPRRRGRVTHDVAVELLEELGDRVDVVVASRAAASHHEHFQLPREDGPA